MEDQTTYPMNQSEQPADEETVICRLCHNETPKSKAILMSDSKYICEYCYSVKTVYAGPQKYKDPPIVSDSPMAGLMDLLPSSFIRNDGDTQSAETSFSSTNGNKTPDRRRCDSCGETVPENAKFCPECGARLKRVCDICGTPAEDDAKFCTNCGQKLS